MEIAKLVLEYVKALVWPLTVLALSLFFRSEIKRVLARLRKAVLPGGVSVDLQAEVHEVKELSEKVESAALPEDRKRTPGIPKTEANGRMIQLGLRPSPAALTCPIIVRSQSGIPFSHSLGFGLNGKHGSETLLRASKLTRDHMTP